LKRVQDILSQIPYAMSMCIECDDSDQGLVFTLPALTQNLNALTSSALHQGALSGFMQTSAITELMLRDSGYHQFKLIRLSVEYIKPATHRATYAQCQIIEPQDAARYVCVTAWQNDVLCPIAKAYLYF
tara:strand:- start:3231 stop:3617 length:387 start_codon:yes stop_codon:yes gene_type:complete